MINLYTEKIAALAKAKKEKQEFEIAEAKRLEELAIAEREAELKAIAARSQIKEETSYANREHSDRDSRPAHSFRDRDDASVRSGDAPSDEPRQWRNAENVRHESGPVRSGGPREETKHPRE
jgi:hypothetical protein